MVSNINNLRFSGLASGLDTDSIVKKLMQAQRLPYNKMEQKKQLLSWQSDAYREINKLLYSFRDEIFNMRLQSTYMNKSVSSTAENKITATATPSAGNSSYIITNATLATAAYNSSSERISKDSNNKIDPNQSLWSMKDKFANEFTWDIENKTENIVISKDSTSLKLSKGALTSGIGTDTDPLSTVSIKVKNEDGSFTNIIAYRDQATFDNANNDDPDTLRAFINMDTGEITFNKELKKDQELEISYQYNVVKFSVTTYKEGIEPDDKVKQDFTVDATSSLNVLLKTINDSSVGVSAFYDSHTDLISVTRKDSGNFNTNGSEMEFEGAFLTDVLGLDSNNEKEGSNATITINGITTERYSNTFMINGVNFTLKDSITSPVTINVSNDVDKNYEVIKKFVDRYNEIIDQINEKVREKKFRDYLPLTEEQRKEMSENEIKLWEEKAKSGLLSGDTILNSLLNNLRNSLSSTVDGVKQKYNSLSAIGITTGSYQENGKLYIDEKKLKEALQAEPNEVMKLFTQKGDQGTGDGIALRLYDNLTSTLDQLTERAGSRLSYSKIDNSTIGKELENLDKRMADFNRRLIQIESRYWRQFTAMEKAIEKANAQSGWLMQQFNMG